MNMLYPIDKPLSNQIWPFNLAERDRAYAIRHGGHLIVFAAITEWITAAQSQVKYGIVLANRTLVC